MKYDISNHLINKYSAEHLYGSWMFDCPFCYEARTRCGVNIDKDVFNCFNCGESGNILNFIMRTEDLSFSKALQFIRKFSKIEVRTKRYKTDIQKLIKKQVKFPSGTRFFNEELNLFGKLAYKYLTKKRGFTKEQINKWGLGYCTEGEYADHIIIPVFEQGQLSYWLARRFRNATKKNRYKNPPNDLFNNGKSQLVYNLDNIQGSKHAFIVEGAFDVIGTNREDVVGIFGKKISEVQFAKIVLSGITSVTICLDPEEIELAYKLGNIFSRLMPTRLIQLPEGTDPGSHGHLVNENTSFSIQENSLIKFKLNNKSFYG